MKPKALDQSVLCKRDPYTAFLGIDVLSIGTPKDVMYLIYFVWIEVARRQAAAGE